MAASTAAADAIVLLSVGAHLSATELLLLLLL